MSASRRIASDHRMIYYVFTHTEYPLPPRVEVKVVVAVRSCACEKLKYPRDYRDMEQATSDRIMTVRLTRVRDLENRTRKLNTGPGAVCQAHRISDTLSRLCVKSEHTPHTKTLKTLVRSRTQRLFLHGGSSDARPAYLQCRARPAPEQLSDWPCTRGLGHIPAPVLA